MTLHLIFHSITHHLLNYFKCVVFQFVGILNVPYIALSTQVHMKPFMSLAEMMGSLLAQISDSKIVNVRLSTQGGKDVTINNKTARQLLEAKVLQGILKKDYAMQPDMISAPGMAKEANIVSTNVDDDIVNNHQYLNLVSVGVSSSSLNNLMRVFVLLFDMHGITPSLAPSLQVTREDGTETTVVGCVFGATPHIVKIDTFEFTFKPEGNYVLVFKNEDTPGTWSR